MNFSVFNGMILFIDSITKDFPDFWRVDCHDEVNNKYCALDIWKEQFLHPEKFAKKKDIPVCSRRMIHCDYAYAITCHKSQGSEWEHVIVYDEYMPPQVWDMKRWRYTSITRAAKQLTYLI